MFPSNVDLGKEDKLPSHVPSKGQDLGKPSGDADEETEMIDTSSNKNSKDNVWDLPEALKILSDQGQKKSLSGKKNFPKAETDPAPA